MQLWLILISLTVVTIGIVLAPVWAPVVWQRQALTPADGVMLSLVVVGMIAMAFGGYRYWGYSAEWLDWQTQQQKTAEVRAFFSQMNSPATLLAHIEQRLAQEPENAEGWRLLGRLQLANQQAAAAVESLAKAYALAPEDTQIQLQYAEALFIQGRRFTPLIETLLTEVLRKQPQEPTALNLLAIAAFQAEDYAQAIAYWQQLLPLYPINTPAAQAIQDSIQRAQAKLEEPK